MKRTLLPLLALSAALAMVLPQMSTAQNDDAPAAVKEKKDYRGPLPFYFGKLGLEEDQKKQLYAIDDEYAAKIEALEKQIEKLEDERDTRMEVVLTPGQKLRLKELREAAAKKAAEKDEADATENPAAE